MNNVLVSVNGHITDAADAKIPALDRGFLYADSVYEATRTFNKKPFHWNFHLKRLFESAKIIHLPIKYSEEEITQEVQKIIDAHPARHINLRIQISGGTNSALGFSRSLAHSRNNLVIIASTLHENPKWWLDKGLKLMSFTSSLNKSGSQSKSGSYYENVMAYEMAREHGFDDALLFSKNGELLEGTSFNIWFINNKNEICTPDLALGLLDGITRQCLMNMFKNQSLIVKEGYFTINELITAREVFITSSSRFLVPVTQIDDHLINDGAVGPNTLAYLQLYLEDIKKDYTI